MQSNWRELFEQAAQVLRDRQAARWFVEDASGGRWPAVLDEEVSPRSRRAFISMVDRRLLGEPVQYVLGHWSFRQLDLIVGPHVLIPRPETEVVVEVALAELGAAGRPHPLVVDLGTGSGAIALSVAWEYPAAEVWGVDLSAKALSVASANLAGLGVRTVGRVHLAQGNWWEGLPAELSGRVDLVVTNPPYIAEGELASLPPEVSEWEPVEALVAGPGGLEALAAILGSCKEWMSAGSALVAEIAPHQAPEARHMALAAGLVDVSVRSDLTGRLRALVAHSP